MAKLFNFSEKQAWWEYREFDEEEKDKIL